MPAGDLVDGPGKFEIRSTLLGVGSNIQPSRRVGISGLGGTPVKDSDLPRAAATGSYGGADEGDVRTVTIPLYMTGATAGAAFRSLVDPATGVWRRSSVDLTLHMWLPAVGKLYLVGRPRGVDAELVNVTFNLIEVLCTFVCEDDPEIHFL